MAMRSDKHTRMPIKCDNVSIGTEAWHYRMRGGIEVYIQLPNGEVASARIPARSLRRFVEEEERTVESV